jgi:hypothetical protein
LKELPLKEQKAYINSLFQIYKLFYSFCFLENYKILKEYLFCTLLLFAYGEAKRKPTLLKPLLTFLAPWLLHCAKHSEKEALQKSSIFVRLAFGAGET